MSNRMKAGILLGAVVLILSSLLVAYTLVPEARFYQCEACLVDKPDRCDSSTGTFIFKDRTSAEKSAKDNLCYKLQGSITGDCPGLTEKSVLFKCAEKTKKLFPGVPFQ